MASSIPSSPSTAPTPPRPLSDRERAALEAVLSSTGTAGVDILRAQLAQATVTGGSPALLDLDVARSVPPAPAADGPLPGRWAVVTDDGDLAGELLVWVRAGYLAGVELAWIGDEPPGELPPAGRIRPVPDDPDRDRLAREDRAARGADREDDPDRQGTEAAVPDEPGWVPDPTGRHQVRYWDGEEWTAYVADDGVQAEDPPDDPPPSD